MKKKILLAGSTGYLGVKFIELYGNKFDILGISSSDKIHPVDLLDFNKVKEIFEDFAPDFVIHTAAKFGRDASTADDDIIHRDPTVAKNLIALAQINHTPFLFTSSEAVYGGKEKEGEYKEDDQLKPRNIYGHSKVISENLVKESGLPYLITRGHRHIGINKKCDKMRPFAEVLQALLKNKTLHLDARKLFKPTFLNNMCDVLVHYIENDFDKQILINVAVEKVITYYTLVSDIANILNFDKTLIHPDGEETGWPQNSTISVKKLKELGYPRVSYKQMLQVIKKDFKTT